MKSIRLFEGKERSLLRRHPWVFQGSVAKGKADSGETVRIEAHDGRFLAWGAYSATSTIRVRAWSFEETERIDHAFFKRRVARALALRARLPIASDGVRLIHGEADGLPGVIVDRYAGTLCAQFSSAGAERFKGAIADALIGATGLTRVYERSDAGVRELEGLLPVTGWLRGEGSKGAEGAVDGPTEVEIIEHGWRLTLDVASGHKTGFYLDQRDNRAAFARWVDQLGCRRVLNCYCYTGGFTVAALAGGASDVVSVDSSAPALSRVAEQVARNGFDAARNMVADADVNQYLRQALAAGESFDAIVLDPPKFAPTAAHAERAARAYKDINRLALKLLAPGGLLFTFSCSGGVGAELFHKIVAGAALDAGVDGAIVQRLEAAPDHPTTLVFPEGEYLKGLAIVKAA
jgi:23S rRNA (cytosine1962-C5)-methyltransferase